MISCSRLAAGLHLPKTEEKPISLGGRPTPYTYAIRHSDSGTIEFSLLHFATVMLALVKNRGGWPQTIRQQSEPRSLLRVRYSKYKIFCKF